MKNNDGFGIVEIILILAILIILVLVFRAVLVENVAQIIRELLRNEVIG